jgi:uncharacterized membrane protein YozB (DUF420 family)
MTTTLSVLSLFLQTAALALILVGIMLVKPRGAEALKRHSYATAAAVIIVAFSILLVMVPSFILYFSAPLDTLPASRIISTAAHGFLGGIVFVIGVAYVFNKKPKNVRTWMRIQALLWLTVFLSGIGEFLMVLGII